MSKGPGKIQRALTAIFDAAPDVALTTTELCQRVYGAAEKRHKVALARAMRGIQKRRPELGVTKRGYEFLWYNRTSVQSYLATKGRYYQRGRSSWADELDDLEIAAAQAEVAGDHEGAVTLNALRSKQLGLLGPPYELTDGAWRLTETASSRPGCE
jgi:hypothetical protein